MTVKSFRLLMPQAGQTFHRLSVRFNLYEKGCREIEHISKHQNFSRGSGEKMSKFDRPSTFSPAVSSSSGTSPSLAQQCTSVSDGSAKHRQGQGQENTQLDKRTIPSVRTNLNHDKSMLRNSYPGCPISAVIRVTVSCTACFGLPALKYRLDSPWWKLLF